MQKKIKNKIKSESLVSTNIAHLVVCFTMNLQSVLTAQVYNPICTTPTFNM